MVITHLSFFPTTKDVITRHVVSECSVKMNLITLTYWAFQVTTLKSQNF